MPAPVGVTSAVQIKLTASAYGTPPILYSPTLTTHATSHPTTWNRYMGYLEEYHIWSQILDAKNEKLELKEVVQC